MTNGFAVCVRAQECVCTQDLSMNPPCLVLRGRVGAVKTEFSNWEKQEAENTKGDLLEKIK